MRWWSRTCGWYVLGEAFSPAPLGRGQLLWVAPGASARALPGRTALGIGRIYR